MAIKLIAPGLATMVQDLGRPGTRVLDRLLGLPARGFQRFPALLARR